MTPHQVIGLVIRLFALWFGLQGVTYLAEAAAAPMPYGTSGGLVLGSFFVAVALLLWIFPLTIARILLPKGDAGPSVTDRPERLIAVAVVVTGIVLVAVEGPHLLWYLLRWFLVRMSGITYEVPNVEVNAEVLVTAAQVAAGFFLALRAETVVAWLGYKTNE